MDAAFLAVEDDDSEDDLPQARPHMGEVNSARINSARQPAVQPAQPCSSATTPNQATEKVGSAQGKVTDLNESIQVTSASMTVTLQNLPQQLTQPSC